MTSITNKFTENQLKWLELLENGGILQGTGFLKYGQAYCCLGVACEFVVGVEPVRKFEDDEIYKFGEMTEYAPQDVKNALNLWSCDGAPGGDEGVIMSLAEMNDEGYSFKEISARIREYPWAYLTNFEKPK